MAIRFTLVLLALLAIAPAAHGQSWYYSGTKSCMDYGNGVSQCFSQGFVQQLSDSRPRSSEDVQRSFHVGQQAGEGFGSLLGVLIGLWIQHHQAVKAETADLRQQLVYYHQAEDEILQNQIQWEQENQQLCVELSKLDPSRSDHWNQSAANSQAFQVRLRDFYDHLAKMQEVELKQKSPKALKQIIDDPHWGVKWRLDLQQKTGFQAYVLHQFLIARVGQYSTTPSGPQPAVPSSLVASAPQTPSETTATVTVERTAVDSEVYLDGEFVGNTPAVLHPPSGNHEVRLTAGRDVWVRTVAVSDGADLRLRPVFQ
jgi:hypothetical protein